MENAGLEDNNSIMMEVSERGVMIPTAAILPLTDTAANNLPPPGLSGPVVVANASNQLSISTDSIAMISCDQSAYAGNIAAADIFNRAASVNATAVIWYSTAAAYCNLTGYNNLYPWVYSMKTQNDSTYMLQNFADLMQGMAGSAYIEIVSMDQLNAANNGTGHGKPSDSNQNQNQNQGNNGPLGPSPGTAVAMIILYSITGVITALFLVIIITGAIRAHRHPERYGPRNIIGRARQTRVKGLARAMLDTLPIVKVGDRGAEAPKPTDVELGEGATAQEGRPTEMTGLTARDARASGELTNVHNAEELPRTSSTEGGIAAAASVTHAQHQASHASDQDNQGCSICTEDFEIGQDQRILPCDHRFHPDCIDPWLLNVSGTCPLCRIDLRPRPSVDTAEVDEDGNPISRSATLESREGEALPPPLGAAAGDRRSVRRSLMRGLMGNSSAGSMSREERLAALREWRFQEARRRQTERGESQAETSEARSGREDDAGLRTRLRNAFRVRTRRTGVAETPAVVSSEDAQEAAEGEASASRPARTS
ncbi:hypothetical protein LTR78_000896 [Recurvomyces mirabilis]|uniref:RING-type domain-containing protein n=1 Tax=Recurvomyces mirabilis TaxID=574656 RepID=A0AAE0WXD2_9PEZI|nr:hypothetical protein LTR78_000896 [Recurvomyces mirabilis]KAK5158867.1 hypothetical protein LTS14_002975 [Recurvomyces mirabilis]